MLIYNNVLRYCMNIKKLENHIRKITHQTTVVYSNKNYQNPLFETSSSMRKSSEYKKLYIDHGNDIFKVGEKLSSLLSSEFKKEILLIWLQKFDFTKALKEEEFTTFSGIFNTLRDLRVMGINKLTLISPEINEKIRIEMLPISTSVIFSPDNIYRSFIYSGVYLEKDILEEMSQVTPKDNAYNMNNKINYQKEILEMNLDNKESKKLIKNKI